MPDETTTTEETAPATAPVDETPAEKTYTKAERDAAIADAVAKRFKSVPDKAELETLKAKAARADELEAAAMTEVEKANAAAVAEKARADAAEARAAKAERDAIVSRLATSKGVPAAALPFVNFAGEDEESIAASIDAYMAALPAPATTTGTGTTPGATPEVTEDEAMRKAFLGLK